MPRLNTTAVTCAVSRRYTFKLATSHPTPTLNNPKSKTNTGTHSDNQLRPFPQIKTAAIANSSDSTWFTSDEQKIATGIISEGNTVFVIRFAFSIIAVDDRATVSWNNSHGSMPHHKNNE